jgi:hypothetical protein
MTDFAALFAAGNGAAPAAQPDELNRLAKNMPATPVSP